MPSLAELSDSYWALVSEYQPTTATTRGVHEFNGSLRRFDGDWLDGMAARFRSVAASARGIAPVDIQERISIGLLIHEAEMWATEIEDRYFVAAIDPYLGPHNRLLSDTRQNTVQTMEQASSLLDRYRQVGDHLDAALRFNLNLAAEGMTPAMASLNRVLDQLEGYLASGLDDDPFLNLAIPEDGSERWSAEAEDLVKDVIRPAFARYRTGLKDHLGPVARPDEKAGLVWIPNGEDIYQHLIHKYTQLDVTAADIHSIGREWNTEILVEEWVDTGRKAFGFETMEATFHRLHTDPAMRFESEAEMLEHAQATVDRAWESVDDWFGRRPATPCQVVPVPAAIASAMPPAYYMQPPLDGSRPGTYFLNTHKPEERDRFEYESTHFHEAIPGHHFDRSLATELEGIPTFRRYMQVYAHTEGWGLYSERLADEMGLFSSEVDRLGMLSADAWRAGRLVVDTGMHALGWSRQQAIDWLREWTPIGLLTIEQEVDRYIGMSGQALSYKMGHIEIMRLRAEAEQRLGDRFDIKGFHDTCLISGAMTLPLLRETVEDWVESLEDQGGKV
jgi:uncharacterized protein (DUF885 family)